jgi:1,4-dihydroxy-2-naphthoate octaprenyltransferase
MADRKNSRLLRFVRPTHIITTIVMYLLGTGLVRYLGGRLDLLTFILGLAWVIMLQLGMFSLGDYFQTPFDPGFFNNLDKQNIDEGEKPEKSGLFAYISVSLLAGAAVIGIILGIRGNLNLAVILVMAVYFLFHILVVGPGVSLDLSGAGEFISATILVIIPPILAYLLQTGEIHLFTALSVFPLFPLNLALILVMRLKRYPEDLANQRETLLVRLGWVQGVFIHNLLVFSGFLLFGLSLLFGMPFKLVGSVFLAIPAGIAIIWYLSSLEDGAPVRWSLIMLLSLIVFFLPVYLMTYSVWIR